MFSSKELYMMNGGQKLYIYKDGFGDVYQATAEEEAGWAKEVVANALTTIDQTENAVSLEFAIDSLRFHEYPDLKNFLIHKMDDPHPVRQRAFAKALLAIFQYKP